MHFTFPAQAAYVGATRIEEASGQDQIAVFSLASITKAVQGISDGLSGIGSEAANETAAGILSWLVMLPSLDCADLSRQATVVLVSPPEGQDMPDQIAIIPLSPVNGEIRLRESLAASYSNISGKSVVYCSHPKDEYALPSISLIITRDTAYVASSRESLRWIARHWKNGTIPTIPDVRPGATISAFFDAPLAAGVVDKLLAGAEATDDTRAAVHLLLSFRDLLRPLDSLHVSVSADIQTWHLTARLTPPSSAAAKAAALLEDSTRTTPTGSPLSAIPRDAYGVSDGLVAPFSALLPKSFMSRYGDGSAYAFFFGQRLLPGQAAPDVEKAMSPFLTGESASGFSITKGEPSSRIQAFALADPAGAAKALRTLLPWGTEAKVAHYRMPRNVNGRTIYSYTARRQASAETAEDYAASALTLLAQMHCVEMAIEGDNLLVVSGPYGAIEKMLPLPAVLRKERTLGELSRALPELPADETLFGAGELRPSQTFYAMIANTPGLGEIARQLPRHGGSLAWRVSRRGDDTIYEASLATAELFALSILQNIDQRQIGGILLDHILGRQDMSK